MTRGRRKDLTIPPSRALLQQRDYRARKAQYLAELEERCQKAEAENALLKKEIDELQAKLRSASTSAVHPPPPRPEVAAASTDLMQALAMTTRSLARFQQAAFGQEPHDVPSTHSQATLNTPISLATPAFTPSPIPPPHRRLSSPRIRFGPSDPTSPHRPEHPFAPPQHPESSRPTRPMGSLSGVYSESECCGGYLDCRGLTEEEGDMSDDEEHLSSRFAQRMSDVRSTATTSSSGKSLHLHPS
ncbi:hypothetical protein OBBRIDRAFT_810052 [Obba rivulosa]|uniref:BZIP domain-containing protein n=1 Tax=Obba rivulosa TaxID=1052685 RepID=A0A8E2DSR4_9APHY|nr:hypothetical protein OBBRIDRAFT_810052 [Obba rivulosa]